MKKILVAVDFSACSEAALDQAIELAVIFGATIDLVHVWEVPNLLPPEAVIVGVGPQQSVLELSRNRAEEALREVGERVRKRGAKIGTALALEGGVPARTIVEEAERGNYDLIVVGTHGRSGLSHALLGSVAERVVRHASKPVLSIRRP